MSKSYIFILLYMLLQKINYFSALLCYCITMRFIKLKYSYFGKRYLVFGWVLNTTAVFCLEIYFEICWKFFTVLLRSTCKSLSSLLSILFQKSGLFFINLNSSNSLWELKVTIFGLATLGLILAAHINITFKFYAIYWFDLIWLIHHTPVFEVLYEHGL